MTIEPSPWRGNQPSDKLRVERWMERLKRQNLTHFDQQAPLRAIEEPRVVLRPDGPGDDDWLWVPRR